jgi:ADP-heptose:LPS heptosyltransferase
MSDGTKILIIKLGALGDFIQALGPMAAIRRHHPHAKIVLMTTKPFEKFAEDCGYFDGVLVDERPGTFNIPAWLRLRKDLNSEKFTRVYDLQNNDRTGFYFKLFSKKPEWVGIAKGASHRNTDPDRSVGHAFDGHVQTLRLAGINDIKIDTLEWMQANIRFFPAAQTLRVTVPGSAPARPEKRWPADHYGRLAQILVQLGYQPVLIGGPAEIDALNENHARLPRGRESRRPDFAAANRRARPRRAAAIGNDTGPMHLIAATGCPCLALFSKTSNPVKHAPMGANVTVILESDLKNLSPEKVLESFRPRQEPPKKSAALH